MDKIQEIQRWMCKLGCYNPILKEAVERQLLIEADSRLKKVERIINNAFQGLLDPNATVPNAEYYVNNNPNTRWKDYLIYNLRHTMGLMGNSDVALLPKVAEIAYNELNFDKENQDLQKIDRLKQFIELMKKDKSALQEFLSSSNVSYSALEEKYAPILQQQGDERKERISQMELERNEHYQIIPINSFEEAQQYGEFTGIDGEGGGALCYTQGDDTWDSFTKDGVNQCYLCLRDDYQSVPAEKGEGYPKDDYGLSMIWLFVDGNGNLANSNVRWNHGDHSYGNVDSIFTDEEISQIVGAKFNEVFKPNNQWQEIVNDALSRLANGEDPYFVFDGCYGFTEGFAGVMLNNKYNFLTSECELLSDQWFDAYYNFNEGFACVKLNGKWNFLTQEGQYLSDQWFDECYNFREGFARVKLNGVWNFLTQEGQYLSEQWFETCYDFCEGFGAVGLSDNMNFINAKGQLLCDQGFDECNDFVDGLAAVELDDKWNYINQEGQPLSDQWFDTAYDFKRGFARVKLNRKWNYINQEGQLLSNQWFDACYNFNEGFARVKLNGSQYLINAQGQLFDDDGNLVNSHLNEIISKVINRYLH